MPNTTSLTTSRNKIAVVGDIHGCRKSLERLIHKIQKDWQWDKIVFLGDYVDGGDDSKGVIEFLVRLQEQHADRIVCLKGNHESWMMGALDGTSGLSWILGMNGLETIASYSKDVAQEFKDAMRKHGISCLKDKSVIPYQKFFYETMPPSHLRFFQNLPALHREEGLIFAHAGVKPGVPAKMQLEYDLLWIGKEFHQKYQGEEFVFFGHYYTGDLRGDHKPLPYIGPNRIVGLDTGSFKTGVLTACLWPDLSFLQEFG